MKYSFHYHSHFIWITILGLFFGFSTDLLAQGYRSRFPTMVAQGPAPGQPITTYNPTGQPPTGAGYPPAYGAQPGYSYSQPAAGAPAYSGNPAPGAYYGAPGGTPYANGAHCGPSGAYPVTPGYNQYGCYPPPYAITEAPEYRRNFLLDTTHIGKASSDTDWFKVTDINLAYSFFFDEFFYTQAPLIVTPGFGFHLWSGPPGTPLPETIYSTYLDFTWRPGVDTDPFGIEAQVRPGIYTDFNNTGSDMFRIQARLEGIWNHDIGSTFRIGVKYYDRLKFKLLPVGGWIWRPKDGNSRNEFRFYFPNPEWRFTLTDYGANSTSWFWNTGVRIGGDEYAMQLDTGVDTTVDYYDLRVYTGVEFRRDQGAIGFFHVGYVWDREIIFKGGPTLKPEDTWMIESGIRF